MTDYIRLLNKLDDLKLSFYPIGLIKEMGNQKNIKTTYEKYTKTPLTYFCKVSLMQFFWWIKKKTRMSPNSN